MFCRVESIPKMPLELLLSFKVTVIFLFCRFLNFLIVRFFPAFFEALPISARQCWEPLCFLGCSFRVSLVYVKNWHFKDFFLCKILSKFLKWPLNWLDINNLEARQVLVRTVNHFGLPCMFAPHRWSVTVFSHNPPVPSVLVCLDYWSTES